MSKWYLNVVPKLVPKEQLQRKIKHGYADKKENGLYTVLTMGENGGTTLEVWKVAE